MLLGVVPPRVWVYILAMMAGMAVLSLSARYFYNMGYEESEQQWQIKIAEERERVRIANHEAEKRGRNLLETYLRNMRSRDARISQLEAEVADNPASVNPSLPADFVRRLNEIR